MSEYFPLDAILESGRMFINIGFEGVFMRLLFTIYVIHMSILATGCSPKPDLVSTKAKATIPSSTYASRLEAALAIATISTRDEALSQVAVDAASVGDGDITKKAVEAISSFAMKDQAGSKAALLLAKAGKGDDANIVAKMIATNSVRDQTLGKIAKGEYGE